MRFGICKIKNAVAELYTAIESTVNTPDDEHYAAALNTAVSTQQICCNAYGEISDSAAIQCDRTLTCRGFARRLLEKILLLYNAPLSSVSTTSEKVKEIEGFYKSLSLLNDDMMNLTEYLSDI